MQTRATLRACCLFRGQLARGGHDPKDQGAMFTSTDHNDEHLLGRGLAYVALFNGANVTILSECLPGGEQAPR
ncbi:hypothetical protein ASA1KI_21330 [Opitutales bacterium ASA1]|nr:hypothetical protein ASA1KI_21330 [Opitutales bacterium ASA1]